MLLLAIVFNNNMEINLQTPALLFPALSLLLLAYTNKFLAIAKLIRHLYSTYREEPQHDIIRQIHSLRRRLFLIRWMQALGVASIFFCVFTMSLIYLEHQFAAKVLFALALLLLMGSLVIAVIEIFLSAGALNVLLKNLEAKEA